MSRRVYEVARELGLSTKEVMGRLNEAGVETKSNFSVVEDPAYERVFGHDSRTNGSRSNGSRNNATEVAAPNARPETPEASPVPRRVRRARRRVRKRSRKRARFSKRVVAYILVAALAFALAAGVGAVAAMVFRGDIELPGQEVPRASERQGDAQQAREQGGAPEGGGGADQAQQEEAGADQEEDAAPQQDAPRQDEGVAEGVARLGEDEYLSRVGGIQSEAVEIFMDSHDKLLLYDALTAQDIDVMRANEAALEEMAREADDLSPPQSYEEQHEVFASAITGLHEAAGEAYELANDPVTAAEVGFDGYDGRVNRVAGLLERSNALLGRDYETIGDPREISPQLGSTEPARGSEEAAQA